MAEYANMFVASAVIATLFFGGWQLPWLTTDIIKSNADVVLRGASIAVIAGVIGVALLLVRFYRNRSYRWGDVRDKEGIVLFSVLGFAALAAAGAFGASFVVHCGPIAGSLLAAALQIGAFFGKAFVFCFVIVWIRWTLPRLRYDQLMALGWKLMLPLGILNVLATGTVLLLK
jgi:NADH-quinone oxidoreductase subunit H